MGDDHAKSPEEGECIFPPYHSSSSPSFTPIKQNPIPFNTPMKSKIASPFSRIPITPEPVHLKFPNSSSFTHPPETMQAEGWDATPVPSFKSPPLPSPSLSKKPKLITAQLIKLINAGGQAAVFLARSSLDQNTLLVVKAFYKKPTDHEIECMKSLSFCAYSVMLLGELNISQSMLLPFEMELRYYDVKLDSFFFDEKGGVVGYCYEWFSGDLEKAITSKRNRIPAPMKCLIALQIGYFLKAVHASGFIFRDLKPANILLNTEVFDVKPEQVARKFVKNTPVIKVTDFGLVTKESLSKKTRCAGTIGYMPLSQMETTTYNQSVDVVAYAITVTEIFLDTLLFESDERDEDIRASFLNFHTLQTRLHRKFNTSSYYLPSDLRRLIENALAQPAMASLEPFLEYFEKFLKVLCFAHELRKDDLSLLPPHLCNTPSRD